MEAWLCWWQSFAGSLCAEVKKIWSEHQDLDGDKVPIGKVADIYWSVGYILGTDFSHKMEEELHDHYGMLLRLRPHSDEE